jgi:hypothetical protein
VCGTSCSFVGTAPVVYEWGTVIESMRMRKLNYRYPTIVTTSQRSKDFCGCIYITYSHIFVACLESFTLQISEGSAVNLLIAFGGPLCRSPSFKVGQAGSEWNRRGPEEKSIYCFLGTRGSYRNLCTRAAKMHQLLVRDISGKTLCVTIAEKSSCGDLLLHLETVTGVPACHQRLLLEGRDVTADDHIPCAQNGM